MPAFRILFGSMFLMLAMALGNIAHASELVDAPSASLTTLLAKAENERGHGHMPDSKADAHQHSGCHGHHIAMEADAPPPAAVPGVVQTFQAKRPPFRPTPADSRTLRPPIA